MAKKHYKPDEIVIVLRLDGNAGRDLGPLATACTALVHRRIERAGEILHNARVGRRRGDRPVARRWRKEVERGA